jgi:hypothetical protein
MSTELGKAANGGDNRWPELGFQPWRSTGGRGRGEWRPRVLVRRQRGFIAARGAVTRIATATGGSGGPGSATELHREEEEDGDFLKNPLALAIFH